MITNKTWVSHVRIYYLQIHLFEIHECRPDYPITKQLYCIFIQKNVSDQTWKYVLELLKMDDDSCAEGNIIATARPDNVELRNA